MSVRRHLRLSRLLLLPTILCVFPAMMCVITSRIRIIGIFILTLAVIAPQAALADWKIYYTGPAAQMFGSYGRGSFATRAQAEAYRVNRPASEVNNSYSAGFDSPTNNSPSSTRSSSTQALIAGTMMQSFLDGFNRGTANAEQAELNRQLAEQQRLLEEQRAQAARILSASHLRAFWDEQDRERQGSLSGTLDAPLQGTAFFGIASNPSSSEIRDILSTPVPPGDQFANDPNVVDLRGVTNPTPALLRGTTNPTPAESGAPAGLQQGAAYVPPSVTPSQASLIPKPNYTLRADILLAYKGEEPPEWHPDWMRKLKDMGFDYTSMYIKSRVRGLASIPELTKDSLDLRKTFNKHLTEYLKQLFTTAGEAANPNANYTALEERVSDQWQRFATHVDEDAKDGIQNNVNTGSSEVVPEGSPEAAGIGTGHEQLNDLKDLIESFRNAKASGRQ